MKVFVTKYALTLGIQEKDAVPLPDHRILVGSCEFYAGKEWYLNREDAVKRANEMKQKRINTLERQIKEIKKIEF